MMNYAVYVVTHSNGHHEYVTSDTKRGCYIYFGIALVVLRSKLLHSYLLLALLSFFWRGGTRIWIGNTRLSLQLPTTTVRMARSVAQSNK